MSDRRRMNAPIISNRRDLERCRRDAQRYLSKGAVAVLGWPEGEAYRTVEARLIDISMGGFSAWVEVFPPRGGAVWLRLDGEKPSAWLKAGVVSTIKNGFSFWARRRVRCRFLESCPYEFFKAAIEGFTRDHHSRDALLESFYRNLWR